MKNPRSTLRDPPWYASALALTIGSTLLVFLLRLDSVLKSYQWQPPTGFEGAAALGIFQVCSGLPVYHDFSRITIGFIYNFGFYQVYGLILRLLPNCIDSVPLVGRFITVGILLAFGIALLRYWGRNLRLLDRLAIVAILISPTVGWWAFALRPDVGGMVALGCSTMAFLAYMQRASSGGLVASAVLLLVAWGFKQPFLVMAPVMVAALLLRREAKNASVFAVILALGVLASVAVNPAGYLIHTVVLTSQHPILARVGISNLGSFIAKSVGLLVPVLLTVRLLPREKLWSHENAFLGAAFLWCFVAMGVLAGKAGASDNYYFPVIVIGMLFLLRNVHSLDPKRRRAVMIALMVTTLTSNGLLLTGLRGRVTLDRGRRDEVLQLRNVIAGAPNPKLVWGEVAALPWVSPGVETRILDASIDFEQAEHVPGAIRVRDLVRDRRYATIAVPDEGATVLDLSGYVLLTRIGSTNVFLKR